MSGTLSIVVPFRGERDLLIALAATVAINVEQLLFNPRTPKLYASGIRYKRESCLAPTVLGGCERFLTALQTLKEGAGDCDDLASWRAAELIVAGDANAKAVPVRSGKMWHCIVVHGDGTKEDPSALLGMKGSA